VDLQASSAAISTCLMLGHHVKFLKLRAPNISAVDLAAGAGPCSLLASQHPVELNAEQRLSGAAGWATCGHPILSARVTES